jgi:hypothetical protein
MSKEGAFLRVHFTTGATVDIVPDGSLASGYSGLRPAGPSFGQLWDEFGASDARNKAGEIETMSGLSPQDFQRFGDQIKYEDGFDIDDLPPDFVEGAIDTADEIAQYKALESKWINEERDANGTILRVVDGNYVLPLCVEAKALIKHKLTSVDISELVSRGELRRDRNGSPILFGECRKGHGVVAFESAVGKEKNIEYRIKSAFVP